MCEVTITQATSEFPMLVKTTDRRRVCCVYQTRWTDCSTASLSEDTRQTESKVDVSKRIGIAKGKVKMPKDFDKWDKDIEEMFGDTI